MLAPEGRIRRERLHGDSKGPALWHRVSRVRRQVQEHLLDRRRVDPDDLQRVLDGR